ncbi:MAG: hypothetical protein GTO14_17730 [Anaerolineales bacterium]|nr:hypothetical protein [Anaerolineales bacterium]
MRKPGVIFSVFVLLALSMTAGARAHNVQPAYLEIEEQESGRLDVTWKVPMVKGSPLLITPSFPAEFKLASPRARMRTAGAVVERWAMVSENGGLPGKQLSIEGLVGTMTDVLVRVKLADGNIHRVVLRPTEASTVVPLAENRSQGSNGLTMRLLSQFDRFRLVILLVSAILLSLLPAARRRGILICTVALLAGALVGYSVPRIPVSEKLVSRSSPSKQEGSRILQGLLLNTYRAFSLEEEEAIYDQLARSVTGDLLADVYLQNQNVMKIDEADGATGIIDRLDIKSIESVERVEEGGVAIVASWDVYGSVRHWGHVHYRCNAYKAQVTILPTQHYWKIAHVQLLEEERIM